MKILFSGIEYDSYNPKRGRSFEYINFYETMKKMDGVETLLFPFDKILSVGKERFNEELLSLIEKEKPDLFFAFMLSDELDPKVLERIKTLTKSVAWFADDSWRFYNYSKFWARHFTWAVTTYSYMPALYKHAGQPNVIRSQWAANTSVFRPLADDKYKVDVSFVGGWSKPREGIISALEKAGVVVGVYGSGWPNGRVSEEEMVRIFSNSRINLGLNSPPGYFNKNSLGRLLFKRSINKVVPDFNLPANITTLLHRGVPQVKARHFEIPACGGFLMTSMADDLDNYYELGKEIVVYKNVKDMPERIKYYLDHEDERKEIAEAGYRRTVRDHTYDKRLIEIFKRIGIGA